MGDHPPAQSKRIFLNLNNPQNFLEAAHRLAIDKSVIALNFHTFGLMGSAATLAETMKISIHKGHTEVKPHTLVLKDITDITPIIDLSRIHRSLHRIIKHPTLLYERIAHLTHVRIPINKDSKLNGVPLHPGVISFDTKDHNLPLAQFIMFKGIPQEFIIKSYELGLKLGAVTSMNYKANPTITNVKEALKFVEQSQVNTFIYQPNVKVEPSYPGIALTRSGITLVREGHVPTKTITEIWHDVPFSLN